ncbi:hypothetical protein FA95DRAFT_1606638 [Auriscalpium vulgare]|uniref:Uncharacterized protein n=1 Tax=Auriscalpium vulgare TaxID=40419 RepID=A0ACB8RSM7_9AGAM|nr:hypothetical protein FA95DRAFT_1606638 [Auriscalpium vulgare]
MLFHAPSDTLKLAVSNRDPLPDDLLGRHAPALRDLYFSTYHIIPLTLPIFARLTRLHIMNPYDSDGLGFDDFFNNLLDGLEGMRELERLKIQLFNKSWGIVAVDEPAKKRRSVALAKLSCLELDVSPRDAMIIISHLPLPAHAVARYNLMLHQEHLPDRFFPLILASVHCHADPVGQSSNAITSLTIDIAKLVWQVVITAQTDMHPHEPALTLTVRAPACVALHALASAHLRELTLNGAELKNCTWPDMPALRRLVVQGAAVASLCANLERVPPIVPALVDLVITDVCIPAESGKGEAEDEQGGNRAEGHGETMWLLPRILAARAEAGCRLEELDVTQCYVDQAWVVRAQEKLLGTRVRVKGDEDSRRG